MSPPTIKYRAACDHCSATKVKCTQEQPQCARCRTFGRECHYSRSLRAGKPPRSSQGLNRKTSNTPVLPRRAPVLELPQPVNSGPSSHGTATQTSYPAMSPNTKPEPAWSANACPYPTPPTGTLYNTPEFGFFPDLQTPTDSVVNTPMDPDWFFDFNNAALASENPAVQRIDSRDTTQQPSPASEGSRTSPRPQTMPYPHMRPPADRRGHIHPNTPTTISPGTAEGGPDQCLRIATETLNRLYELPSFQINAETKHFSIDHVLSSTARAIQICHDLVTCPCAKDFHFPIILAMIASKVLSWYQAVVYIRDTSTDIPPPPPPPTTTTSATAPFTTTTTTMMTNEIIVDGQLASYGAYPLDNNMGWVLKNHIVMGQLQRLHEFVQRFHENFVSEGQIGRMGSEGGGRVYQSMSELLRSRLLSTMCEIEGRLKAGSGC